MKKIFTPSLLEDSYLASLILSMSSLIPFFTLGFLGMDTILWVASGVGFILLLLGIVRMIYCIRNNKVNMSVPAVRIIATYYSIPYSFLLSFLILRIKDISVEFILWFAIAIFILSTPAVIKEFKRYSKI